MTIQTDMFADTPRTPLPGSIGINPIAPLYVDGIPVAQAASPVGVLPSPGKTGSAPRFWSSIPRMPGDLNEENLVVTLSKTDYINYIHLELAHFPQQAQPFWMDENGAWQPMLTPSGRVLAYVVNGSIPAVVNNPAALAEGINPYHYGAGHWLVQDDMIAPVVTGQILICLTREFVTLDAPGLPRDPGNNIAPYPLGIRNLDFGCRIRSISDAPVMGRSPDIVTERVPFTSSSDIRGNSVQLAVRENRAGDLAAGIASWKSRPQPRSEAVVSIFVDARNATGGPQVIDRFYISPVTSGVRVNLYYSPEPPPVGPFPAVDTPLGSPLVTATGSELPFPDSEGLFFPQVTGWVTISSDAPGVDYASPWWQAIEVMPQFSSSDPGTYSILDDGIFQLYYQAGSWFVNVSGGSFADWSFSFAANQKLQFILGFDGQQLFAISPIGGGFYVPSATVLPLQDTIQFGSFINTTGQIGNFRLTSYILKQEFQDVNQGTEPAAFAAWAADPEAFVNPDGDPAALASFVRPGGPGPTTMNALIRFSVSFILAGNLGLNPFGFVGGPGSLLEGCSWTPIAGDYAAARGYLQFDPVRACCFKIEFTGLQAQLHEFFEPVSLTAKTFPVGPAVSAPLNIASPGIGSSSDDAPGPSTTIDTGLLINQSAAAAVAFADTPLPRATPPAGSALATEAAYATDLASAAQLAEQGGSLYNFQPWQPQPSVPRFQQAGIHAYQSTDVRHINRVAYFVSLSQLQMFRTDYTAQDDTEIYIDNLGDAVNITPASLERSGPSPLPWVWEPGSLVTPPLPPGSFAQSYSTVFGSLHAVRGVQLATVQSGPVQLLTDPDFDDATLSTWEAIGDAAPLEIVTNVTALLGNLVRVRRQPRLYTWASISEAYPYWSSFPAGTTWDDLQSAIAASSFGGIAYDGTVTVTQAGRLHLAARVFSPGALSAPLTLQLLDGNTSQVLAEQDFTVSGGAPSETYIGFTLGTPAAPSSYTWQQVQAKFPTWNSLAGLNWDQVDTFIPPLGSTVTARIIQKGLTEDTWYVDTISLFEDSITWEFSNDGGLSWHFAYDIRNNPHGVMLFPPPVQGSGNQLMWRLSGYRPGLHVSALAIRPWYGVHPFGIPPKAAGAGYGPNKTPLDHYGRPEDDPRWKAWNLPVPQDWFYAVRQRLFAVKIGPPAIQPINFPPSFNFSEKIILGEALVVPAEAAVAEFRWLGAAGTFGALTSLAKLPTGQSLAMEPVAGWGCGPGEAFFYSLATPDEKIIISTVPLSENEIVPTMDHAEINVYDPSAALFYRNVIPTNLGALTALRPGFLTGGTDAGGGDLCMTADGRVFFTCTGYWFGWNVATIGLYPAIGFLQQSSGRWVFDNYAVSKTSNQLQATNSAAYNAISSTQSSGLYGTRGLAQVIPLPVSGHIAAGHYFPGQGFESGLVSVWDSNANLICTYQIPSMNASDGITKIEMSPRELKADPTSIPGDERFAVIYDVFPVAGGTFSPDHVIQEFSYNSITQTITPKTKPFVAADDNWSPDFCEYDSEGTFYAAGSPASGPGLAVLTAANVAVWKKPPGSDRAFALQAPPVGSWPVDGSYATKVIPDGSLGFARQQGISASTALAIDPQTGALIYPGLWNGFLGAVIPDQPPGSGTSGTSANNLIPGANLSNPYGFDDNIFNLLSAGDSLFPQQSSPGNWRTVFDTCSITWVAAAACPSPPPGGGNVLLLSPFFNTALAIELVGPGSIAVRPNQRVGFSASFLAKSPTPGQNCGAFIAWLDGSGGNVGNTPAVSVNDMVSGWVTVTGSAYAPLNAAKATLVLTAATTTVGQGHYVAAMSLVDLTAPPGWGGFVTNVYRDNSTSHSGNGYSLALIAPFTQTQVFAQGPQMPVMAGREYLATGWLKTASGTAPGPCFIQIRWFDSTGRLLASAPQIYTPQSSTSQYVYMYSGALPPPGAAFGAWCVLATVASPGDTVNIDDITFVPQPWTAVAHADLGILAWRAGSASAGPGRPCITGRTLWIPVGVSFSPSESAAYNSQQATAPGYAPDANHPQFLIAVDLNRFLVPPGPAAAASGHPL